MVPTYRGNLNPIGRAFIAMTYVLNRHYTIRVLYTKESEENYVLIRDSLSY